MVLKMLKGQGATEYLVLLAVVLIIALVSIALLGFFPGVVPDARITQSNSYWQSARPFAIVESAQTDTTMMLVLRNNDASGSLTVGRVQVGSGSTGALGTAGIFAPGETKNVTVLSLAAGCAPGTVYDYNVTITYNSSNGVPSVQYGGKNLVGKCG